MEVEDGPLGGNPGDVDRQYRHASEVSGRDDHIRGDRRGGHHPLEPLPLLERVPGRIERAGPQDRVDGVPLGSAHVVLLVSQPLKCMLWQPHLHASATTSPPVDPIRLFDDLVRCETRLYNELNDRLRTAHGIVTSQFEFLRFVRNHPDSRVADLATWFAAGLGAISKAADRLERSGWMARTPNPADRRSSLLSLTAAGAELVTAAEATFTRTVEELVAGVLDPAQLIAAAAALASLRAALERDRVGTPIG